MGMTCYTDWKFIRTGRGAYGKAKGLLKYLTFRDDRDHHIPRAGGPDRWVDCGLGGSWREIMDSADELQSQQVLMRSLVLRPPQELIAQLEEVDPELWARRREVMSDLVEHVMEAEMERAGVKWPGGRQPLDLPYSYVIHAPDDAQGIESLHAHVITAAMDRNREQPFNVYPKDTQHTREVAERETERLFQLERVRDRQLGRESREGPEHAHNQQPDEDWRPSYGDREIEMPDFHGR